jgi:hypothetical protein
MSPSVEESVKKMWYIQMEYYSAIKKNETMSCGKMYGTGDPTVNRNKPDRFIRKTNCASFLSYAESRKEKHESRRRTAWEEGGDQGRERGGNRGDRCEYDEGT